MEEITARYSEFLQRQDEKSESVSSEDQEHHSNQKEDSREPDSGIQQGNSEGRQDNITFTMTADAEKSGNSQDKTGQDGKPGKSDNSLDEWPNDIIEKNEVVKHQEAAIHDNISRQFNDSNYWKNAVMDEKHSKKLDDLISEVNI